MNMIIELVILYRQPYRRPKAWIIRSVRALLIILGLCAALAAATAADDFAAAQFATSCPLPPAANDPSVVNPVLQEVKLLTPDWWPSCEEQARVLTRLYGTLVFVIVLSVTMIVRTIMTRQLICFYVPRRQSVSWGDSDVNAVVVVLYLVYGWAVTTYLM